VICEADIAKFVEGWNFRVYYARPGGMEIRNREDVVVDNWIRMQRYFLRRCVMPSIVVVAVKASWKKNRSDRRDHDVEKVATVAFEIFQGGIFPRRGEWPLWPCFFGSWTSLGSNCA